MSNPSKIEKKLLHHTGKAIADFNMIQTGDKVMVCLSGGKDSFTLLTLLTRLRDKTNGKFSLFAFTLDQSQPGWDDSKLKLWLDNHGVPYEILTKDTYSIVKDKIPEGKTYCSLCSRLRRGIIYRYAEEHGFNKIALGHHRDDMIETLLLSMFYGGHINAMPAKLLSDNKKHIIIRPMAYCHEADIIDYANEQHYPIIPCNLCGAQENLARQRIKNLLKTLTKENPNVPSNMLHALQSIKPSQLLDHNLFDFKGLEDVQKQALSSQDTFDSTDENELV